VLGGVIGRERAVVSEASDLRSQELRQAAGRLTRAVCVFYGIAALSIVVMVLSGRTEPFANSTSTLIRGLQGLLLFPLAIWWLRSERQIHLLIRVLLVGVVLLSILNTVGLATGVIKRAGIVWFVNQTDNPIGGPNEAASTMLLMLALLAVRQTLAHRTRNLVLVGLVLAILVATSSRSGLLASLAFAGMVMPRVRVRWVLLAVLAIGMAIPLIPQDYWTRLGRTLVLERGTFEAFTSLIRIYGWKTAWSVFLDHPLLGVGYVAYPYVSDAYGDLRIRGNPVDNYYLETAAGMGVVGVAALAVVILRLFQLGAAVRRLAPAGSLGHVMARFHAPFMIGLLIVNLTGNNFVGMVVLGQIALWCAMLVRAGHLALADRSS
jgi:O-antigen ligase